MSFTVSTDEDDYIFPHNSNVFSRKFQNVSVDLTTVEMNKTHFTKKELQGANLAKEIEARMSFESGMSLIQVIKTGSVLGMPITIQDVRNMKEIYGINPAKLKGNSTAKKPKLFETIEIEKAIEKNLTMRLDLVYFDNEPFLTTITNPLNYFSCDPLPTGKSTAILAKMITEKIMMYRGEGFSITTFSVTMNQLYLHWNQHWDHWESNSSLPE